MKQRLIKYAKRILTALLISGLFTLIFYKLIPTDTIKNTGEIMTSSDYYMPAIIIFLCMLIRVEGGDGFTGNAEECSF